MKFIKRVYSSFVNWVKKHKVLALSFLLIVLGVCVLGLPYYKIGFLNDDFSSIFYSKLKNWKDVLRIFHSNLIDGSDVFNEMRHHSINMFNVVYRPLRMLVLGVQYIFWGLSAYKYYLFNVLLHSINSVLIFYIYVGFIEIKYAFIGALLFLFHGTIGFSIFLICSQDLFNLFFFLLLIIFYKKYFYLGKYRYFIYSAIFLLLGLFTRESLIVLPFAFFLILLIWELYQNGGFIKSFILVLKKTYLFFIVSAFYLIVRFFLFGIGSGDLGYLSFSTRVISFKHYIWNGFEVLKDLSGFTFLSNPDPRLKVLILVPFVVFLLFLFFKSTKKIYLWLLGVATLMFSWPSWLVNHHDRYLYLSLPFFILFLLILFKYSKIDFRRGFRKKLVNVFFYILILWGAIDSSVRIKRNAELTYLGDLALKDLAKEHCENISENTLLVFCGLPHWLFYPCLPQAIWLYSGNEKLKVFDVRSVDFIIGNYRRLESYKNIKEGFSVHKIKNGYRFISNDEKLYFYAPPNDKGDVYNITVGIKVVNERYDKWRAKSVSLIFDKELFASRQDVKFFSWDWRKQRFCLL